ncbi:MAG TPA: 50S ribosomal protein L35 [Candidatus Saccharimonadales bacterium]|jgi:large subunit ribosomal protein L35|nr:50S ribosomal protein L35 [Candidatus Saccharimonadales bacterium]
MPKLKTHSGTKDRVRLTKNGKVRVGHPNTNHFMEKKSGGRRRSLTGLGTLTGKSSKAIKSQLGA